MHQGGTASALVLWEREIFCKYTPSNRCSCSSPAVTISTSVPFDGLLVTGLYTSTPVQSAPIPAPAAFGFGKTFTHCWGVFLSCNIGHLSSALHCKNVTLHCKKKKKRFYETFSVQRRCKAHECVHVEIRDFSYIQLLTRWLGGANMWLTDVPVWETRWNPGKGGMMSHRTSTTGWHTKKRHQCQGNHD